MVDSTGKPSKFRAVVALQLLERRGEPTNYAHLTGMPMLWEPDERVIEEKEFTPKQRKDWLIASATRKALKTCKADKGRVLLAISWDGELEYYESNFIITGICLASFNMKKVEDGKADPLCAGALKTLVTIHELTTQKLELYHKLAEALVFKGLGYAPAKSETGPVEVLATVLDHEIQQGG